MGFLSRLFGYIKALVTGGVESRMDPRIQIEQAMADARKRDLDLRNQAARVIAHRTQVQMKLDSAIEDAAKAREQAAAALRNADAAAKAGNTADVDKWGRAAQALAMKLQTSETMVETLKGQYEQANQQADIAKEQVNQNAMRLQELSTKRIELLGKIEQAKMQEEVNATLETLNKPMADTAGPTMREIEDKINARMASASAKAELEEASIEGAQRELEQSTAQLEAQARLEKLREELGLPAPSAAPAESTAPAEAAGGETTQQGQSS